MPFMGVQSLLTAFVILLGCGLYLRMVAKEKRRREKHLELRLIQKRYVEAERQKQQERQTAAAKEVVVVQALPVSIPRSAAA